MQPQPQNQRLRLNSLGSKLFLAVMGGALIGLAGMGFLFYQTLEAQALKEVSNRLDSQVKEIEGQLNEGERFLESLAAAGLSLQENKAQPEAYKRLLVSLMSARPELVTGFGVLQAPNGLVPNRLWFAPYIQEVLSTPQGERLPAPNQRFEYVDLFTTDNYPQQDYYKDTVKAQNRFWTEPYVSETYPLPLTTYAGPIRDRQGTVIGVFNGDISLKDLNQIASRKVYRNTGHFVIVTQGGALLAYPPDPPVFQPGKELPKVTSIPQLQQFWSQIQADLSSRQPVGIQEVDATNSYWVYQRVPSTQWVLMATVPYSVIIEPAVAPVLIGVAIVAALLGGTVFLFVRNLNHRLQPILDECNKLAATDAQAQAGDQDEIGQLSASFFNLLRQQTQLLQQQQATTTQAQTLKDITVHLTQSLKSEDILKTAVAEIRRALNADRVIVYRFDADWKGTITEESVAGDWPRALGAQIADPCFADKYVEQYRQGRVQATPDIAKAGLTECHFKQLEPFAVKANLVAPILVAGHLMGLLIAHQCAAPRNWQPSEIDLFTQLATQVGLSLERAALLAQDQEAAARSQILKDITVHLTQALQTEDILQIAVEDIQQALQTDRVIVYRFDANWKGTITEESVAPGFPRALGAQIADPCFADKYVERYKQGRVQATPDIAKAGLTDCHLKQLEPFAVKANLVAPILVAGKLMGLLIAHQCSAPRQWQAIEIDLFTQLATQVGLALERSELLGRSQKLAEEQQQRSETTQMQLLDLLNSVEGATRGDLTVRANVTADEIGIVADFFNSIIQSLRQIVTQVKQSAEQVNTSVGSNEATIRQLAESALQQATEITRTLDSVQQMSQSVQDVAENARQAAAIARSASTSAQTGGAAIDRTVASILNLRETVAETAKKVKRLGESSLAISKAVTLINQLATKTRLLAINASIEAALAGEQGQGFAVVAEEVGSLAVQSASATQEIAQIVEAIQRETGEVVRAMEDSTAQVVEGTNLVEQTKRSLGQILDVSRQIDELVESISTATVSQSQTSQTLTALMQQIAQVSERTSESSRQASDALKQTVEVAQQLQASVGTFKVG